MAGMSIYMDMWAMIQLIGLIPGGYIPVKCHLPLRATIQGHGKRGNGIMETGILGHQMDVRIQPILKIENIGGIGI